MDLPSAISDFSEMLALGSNALRRLIERQSQAGSPAAAEALLSETQDIARRLSAIAAELGRHTDPVELQH